MGAPMASASSGGNNMKSKGKASGGGTPSALASDPAAVPFIGDADMDKQTKQMLKLPVTTLATKLRTKSMKGYTEMLTVAQKAKQAAKDCVPHSTLHNTKVEYLMDSWTS